MRQSQAQAAAQPASAGKRERGEETMTRLRRLSAASSTRAVLRRLSPVLALLAVVVMPSAEAQQADGALYVIVHIDIVSAKVGEGEALLRQFGVDSRKDDGVVHFDVLQEATRRNHFTIVEAWQSQKQFEAHEAAEHTRQFREKLYPIAGGPFDTRLHRLFP
jgi:quinol monooxygenase YgiN